MKNYRFDYVLYIFFQIPTTNVFKVEKDHQGDFLKIIFLLNAQKKCILSTKVSFYKHFIVIQEGPHNELKHGKYSNFKVCLGCCTITSKSKINIF